MIPRPPRRPRYSARSPRAGFTLVEIMIVVLIIGILVAIAVPNFVRARKTSRATSCIKNLKAIESAKEQWIMDNRKTEGEPTDMSLLFPAYLHNSPLCPSSGLYVTGNVGIDATCSEAADGHRL